LETRAAQWLSRFRADTPQSSTAALSFSRRHLTTRCARKVAIPIHIYFDAILPALLLLSYFENNKL